MSAWDVIARVLGAVPALVRALKPGDAKPTPLAPPLGESEAARLLRLEDERRAAERAKVAQRGPGKN